MKTRSQTRALEREGASRPKINKSEPAKGSVTNLACVECAYSEDLRVVANLKTHQRTELEAIFAERTRKIAEPVESLPRSLPAATTINSQLAQTRRPHPSKVQKRIARRKVSRKLIKVIAQSGMDNNTVNTLEELLVLSLESGETPLVYIADLRLEVAKFLRHEGRTSRVVMQGTEPVQRLYSVGNWLLSKLGA